MSLETDKIVVKLKEEVNDFLNDRYAEYAVTDEIDAQWDEIVTMTLDALIREFDDSFKSQLENQAAEMLTGETISGRIEMAVCQACGKLYNVGILHECDNGPDPIDLMYGFPTGSGR